MLTKNGPRVLEYNCRFGDPETQVILPLLESDLFEIMSASVEGLPFISFAINDLAAHHHCSGRLHEMRVEWATSNTAVTVVAASGGYPEKYSVNKPITGLSAAKQITGTVRIID